MVHASEVEANARIQRMTTTAAKIAITAATIVFSLSVIPGTSFAQGGGFQWNKSAPTLQSVAPSEPASVVHAASLNSYSTGETRPGVVAQHEPNEIIAMGASCYYLVQNGTWLPSGATTVN